MLVVETIAKIRRAHFIQGKSIKQICRELRVSRNTVRKVVRSGATEFSYDRSTQPRPKIDPWRSDLDEMLAENDRQPKRQRLTLVRIYEELRNRGYDGSYDAVRRYAASWSKATREASAAAYVPLSFDPGDAYQFDWSHEVVLIDVCLLREVSIRIPFCIGSRRGHSPDGGSSPVSGSSDGIANGFKLESQGIPYPLMHRPAVAMIPAQQADRCFRRGGRESFPANTVGCHLVVVEGSNGVGKGL